MTELIAIATYRRPTLLSPCIHSVLGQMAADDRVLVVDNDPLGSGRPAVDSIEDSRVIYVVEPTPGIAAARNRALEFLRDKGDHFDALLFIDDDETAAVGWLDSHIRGISAHLSDATFGPVVPVYDARSPWWVRRMDFFARVGGTTGDDVKWPATNNVRISADFLRVHEALTFSDDYSMTGGSDTDFFFRMRSTGAKLTWLGDAQVLEVVPPERANARWLWKRGVRLGNVSARMLERRGWSSPKICLAALGRLFLSIPLSLAALLRSRPIGPELMHLPKGIGMIRALGGRLTQEYARDEK